MADSDSGIGITKQAKMMLVGAAFVAWGVIGAIVSYVNDSNSFDASQGAVLHLVLWVPIGLIIIFWYSMGPGAHGARSDSDPDRRDGF